MPLSLKLRFLLAVAAFAGGCFLFSTDVPGQKLPPPSDIRSVDFRNFEYDAACAGEDTIRVKLTDGRFESRDGDFPMTYEITDIAIGDVDGDRNDDAVVLGFCNTGGTGWFSEAFIFAMRNGAPVQIAKILGGDRADGGIRRVGVENGLVVVEANEANEFSGACCPEVFVTTNYRITGGRATAVGKPLRVELYPVRRISFKRGEKGLETGIFLDENRRIARFSLKARAGQRLRIRIGDARASVSLLKGDASVIREGADFEAVLNETGEFVVQIVHPGGEPVKAKVVFAVN